MVKKYLRFRKIGTGARVAYTVIGTILLLGAWEWFATSFVPPPVVDPSTAAVHVDLTQNENLDKTLAAIPETAKRRLVFLGCSQVAGVKDRPDARWLSLPFQFQSAALQAGADIDIVDLSANGQQAVESLYVLLRTIDKVKPDVVVIGAGLFSMQRSTIREQLRRAPTTDAMQAQVAGLTATCLDPASARALHTAIFSDTAAADTVAAHPEKTIQQHCDEAICAIVTPHVALARNQDQMYNRLLSFPIKRDLVTFVTSKMQGLRVARRYQPGPAYATSLAALKTMAELCRQRGTKLVLVALPFDGTRPPNPYEPADEARLVADLAALSDGRHTLAIDLGRLLPTTCFQLYGDGSPDNMHFTVAGHRQLGRALADRLAAVYSPENVTVGGPEIRRR